MGLISRVSSRTYRKSQKLKKNYQLTTWDEYEPRPSKKLPDESSRNTTPNSVWTFTPTLESSMKSRRPNQALEKPDCRFHHPHHETNPKGTSSRYLHQTSRGGTRTTRQLRPRAICSLRAIGTR